MISSLLALTAFALGASAQDSSGPSVFTKYTISAPGINASFIPYGARLTNLFVPDRNGTPQDVVLGYDSGTTYLNDTETDHTYFGAVVGRYANRIKNGTFTVQYVCSISRLPSPEQIWSFEIVLESLELLTTFQGLRYPLT